MCMLYGILLDGLKFAYCHVSMSLFTDMSYRLILLSYCHSIMSFLTTIFLFYYFQDLQTQIDSHQRQYELLNVAGKKISERGDNSNPATPDGTLPGAAGAMDTQALKQRLDEMNERWSQLRAKTVQIR